MLTCSPRPGNKGLEATLTLEEASGAINEIFRRDLRRSNFYKPTHLLQALTTAAVVAYARPFVVSRGNANFADRAVPGSLLRVLTSSEREFHNRLLIIRNTEVAHSDADVADVSIEVFSEGHGGNSLVTRAPFTRDQLRSWLQMITKLNEEMHARFETLRTVLPHNVWL